MMIMVSTIVQRMIFLLLSLLLLSFNYYYEYHYYCTAWIIVPVVPTPLLILKKSSTSRVIRKHNIIRSFSSTSSSTEESQQHDTATDSIINSGTNTIHANRDRTQNHRNDRVPDNERRNILQRALISSSSSLALFMMNTSPAYAIFGSNKNNNNDLFQSSSNSNILTNPILEQIRIWEQDEADNIKYKGELERGNAGNKGQVMAYPKLLIPILHINYNIQEIYNLLVTNKDTETMKDRKSLQQQKYNTVLTILQQDQYYDTINFKRIFNAYADNIYYNDPERANLYLGGGATPKSIQSLAYLLRNEILDNIDNLRAEINYQLLQNGNDNNNDNNNMYDNEECERLITNAYTAIQQYISMVVPPNELQRAKELMTQNETI